MNRRSQVSVIINLFIELRDCSIFLITDGTQVYTSNVYKRNPIIYA